QSKVHATYVVQRQGFLLAVASISVQRERVVEPLERRLRISHRAVNGADVLQSQAFASVEVVYQLPIRRMLHQVAEQRQTLPVTFQCFLVVSQELLSATNIQENAGFAKPILRRPGGGKRLAERAERFLTLADRRKEVAH